MNIPAPGSGYSNYGYSGGIIRENFVSDPSNSQPDYEYRNTLQAWWNQFLPIYQRVMSGRPEQGDPDPTVLQQYRDMAFQYAQAGGIQLQQLQGNEWDPNGGAMGAAQQFSTAPSYQDGNHVVFEDGNLFETTITAHDANTKQIDAYQKNVTVKIPSNAASVSVVQTAEGDDVKWEVTVTFPNGTTRKIICHNVDREGFQLNLQSPDTSQVHVDASVTSGTHAAKLNNSELGSSSQSQQAGDPPTRMDGDKRVYDGQSFDISPVPAGTNKETKVLASGDVSITPNSNEEYYVMEYQAGPPSKYIVKVYANEADKAATPPKIKETITIDGSLVDHISFAGDPSRIEFAGALHASGDVHALNSSAAGAAKISMGTSGSGLGDPLDPNHLTDNIPDSKDETTHTAYYNNPDNVGEGVDLHAYYDDTYNIHDITTPGPVTIRTTNYSDVVEITRTGTDPNFEYEIKVKKNGTSPVETFKVKGPPSSIKIDALPANVFFRVGVDIGPPAPFEHFTSTQDSKISIAGATAAPATPAAPVPAIVTALKAAIPGLTDEQLLQKMAGKFDLPTPLTMAQLQAAITSHSFPPPIPTAELINFIKDISPAFKSALDATNGNSNANVLKTLLSTATTELIKILKAIYPEQAATIAPATNPPASWTAANDIKFGNSSFTYSGEGANNHHEVVFTWYA